MAGRAHPDISAPPARAQSSISVPAEVLYLIANYAFSTWTDHELWFRLGNTCRLFRDAVSEHVAKGLRDKQTALHTRFEQHCKGRIIRDAASVTRIESLVTVPVYLQAAFYGIGKPASDDGGDDEAPTDADRDDSDTKPQALPLTGQWDFRSADKSDDRYAVFEVVCSEQTEQDLLNKYAANAIAPGTEPVLAFTTKALSLETAETGKIEFDDIPVHPRSVTLVTKSDQNRSPGLVFAASLDWREIWAKKLGRERYCQKRQTEKQIAWQAVVKKNRAELTVRQEARAAEMKAAAEARAKAQLENAAATISRTAQLTL